MKERNTHIHKQRKSGDSLHGQNQERDHGKVSAVRVSFNPGQNLLKGRALISVESIEKIHRNCRKFREMQCTVTSQTMYLTKRGPPLNNSCNQSALHTKRGGAI